MPTNVTVPDGAAAHPVRDVLKSCGQLGRRPVRMLLAVGIFVGFQGVTVGQAAVSTLPSALLARPFSPGPPPIPKDFVEDLSDFSPPVGELSPPVAEFMPELDKRPGLFDDIIEVAFPSVAPLPEIPLQIVGLEQEAEAPESPDELIPFGGREVPRWLVHSILRAAHVTGVDPVYMMTLADVESSLSPDAKAPTSSAEGLFQFIDSTWLETVSAHAADYGFKAVADAIKIVDGEPVVRDEKDRAWVLSLRCDPYFSALMAGELIKDVEHALREQGERELAEAELYLAHFLGAKSAVTFLETLDKDPNMKAAKLFPRAAKANAALFTERHGRKRRAISVAEFYNKIDSKIVRRMDRYEGIGPLIAEVSRDPWRSRPMAMPTLEANALMP